MVTQGKRMKTEGDALEDKMRTNVLTCAPRHEIYYALNVAINGHSSTVAPASSPTWFIEEPNEHTSRETNFEMAQRSISCDRPFVATDVGCWSLAESGESSCCSRPWIIWNDFCEPDLQGRKCI